MELAFHPEALGEFKAEIVDYETKQPGLGAAFADEVLRTIELARVFPRRGAPAEPGARSRLAKRFPFAIYYEAVQDTLWVWAVMHAARQPGDWKTRQREQLRYTEYGLAVVVPPRPVQLVWNASPRGLSTRSYVCAPK